MTGLAYIAVDLLSQLDWDSTQLISSQLKSTQIIFTQLNSPSHSAKLGVSLSQSIVKNAHQELVLELFSVHKMCIQ